MFGYRPLEASAASESEGKMQQGRVRDDQKLRARRSTLGDYKAPFQRAETRLRGNPLHFRVD